MLLVMFFHSDFLSLGRPLRSDLINNTIGTSFKIMVESACSVCVNVFVLISGWFLINPSRKGLCKYLFQCFFFLIGIYLFFLLCGLAPISINGIKGALCLTSLNWFLRAYLALYIISPILNSYLRNTDRRTQRNVLISFYVFQTIYGCSGAAAFVEYGYSTFSFIGLYLLANYIRYSETLNSRIKWGGLFFLTVVLNSIAYGLGLYLNKDLFILVYGYSNPLVIFGAVCLIKKFEKIQIRSAQTARCINWIASSSFAVYLLHANPNIFNNYFKKTIIILNEHFSGILTIMSIFFFVILVFIVAILLDQPRKWAWRNLSKMIDK